MNWPPWAAVGRRQPPARCAQWEEGQWFTQLIPAIERLERLLNPERLEFDDKARGIFGPALLAEPVGCIRASLDRMLTALNFEAVADKLSPLDGGEHVIGDSAPWPKRRKGTETDSGEWDRMESAAHSLSPATPTGEDGPVEPDGVRWHGVVYRGLSRKPFLAIRYLWEQQDRTALAYDLAEPVWGDVEVDVPDNGCQGLRRQTNAFFRKHGIPLHVVTKHDEGRKSLRLTLIDGPPLPAKTSPKKKPKRR